jgi:intein-encoded DNA endonuclease-like protein
MPASIASTRASSRRDKHRPGSVRVQVVEPRLLVDDARDAHVAFHVKTRANAREFILQCRSELRDGHATFDVVRRFKDFETYVYARCASSRA